MPEEIIERNRKQGLSACNGLWCDTCPINKKPCGFGGSFDYDGLIDAIMNLKQKPKAWEEYNK